MTDGDLYHEGDRSHKGGSNEKCMNFINAKSCVQCSSEETWRKGGRRYPTGLVRKETRGEVGHL